MIMVSTTEKGHILIPAPLRRKYHIKKGTRIRIEESGDGTIVLKPFWDDSTEDPIENSKGILKGKTSLLKSLLDDRKKEASRGK